MFVTFNEENVGGVGGWMIYHTSLRRPESRPQEAFVGSVVLVVLTARSGSLCGRIRYLKVGSLAHSPDMPRPVLILFPQ